MKLAFRVTVLLVLAAGATHLAPQTDKAEQSQIWRMLQDASRALQAGNAPLFLSCFDRGAFAGYARLESHIVALTRQSEIASSIQKLKIEKDGEAYRVELNWILQITLLDAPSPVETRKEDVELRAVRSKKKWKVAGLKPVDLFKPIEPN